MVNKRIQPATNIGHVQRYVNAAIEHLSHVEGHLIRVGLLPKHQDRERDYVAKFGGAGYPLAAAQSYLHACREGMAKFAGSIEGQLCPYEDCGHHLAIESEGWCTCGHCLGPFLARDNDGDYEDYHCRPPRDGETIPEARLFCRDLGPSWATPKDKSND